MSKKNKNKIQPIPKVIRKSLGNMIEEVQKMCHWEEKFKPEDDGCMGWEEYDADIK